MPQDSLRSAVYRSFVTCDDPKGVVECGTIRRSRSGSEKMEHKNGDRKAQNRSNLYAAGKPEREETASKAAIQQPHSSSSCQLMEVSRGAHKLNQVIDSWSKGLWCDGHSRDIAKDLLKGALDLQDSLHMLGKLQEASHYMARLKKKKKKKKKEEEEKCGRVRTNQVVQRMNSSPVGELNYPRLSADGSSGDCIEELRKVIRDSLARQNLLPKINAEEERCFSRRYLDSVSDNPSTSSSHSSTVQTENFTSMDSSVSSAALEKMASSPTLVAKLMGLEEMPSKPLQTKSQKEQKIFSQQRPIFEMDIPKARKSEFVFRKEDPQRRAVKDIFESIQFKGLQKSNSKGIKPDSHQWRDFNDSPPIVLIKPRRYPHLRLKEKFVPLFQEGNLNTQTMLKKVKVREEPPSKTIDSNNRGLNFNEMSRRVKAEETPMHRVSQQDGGKDSQEKEATPVKKELKIKQKLSTKMESSSPVTQPLLKKEATDKMPTPAMSSRKPVEKEAAKAKNLSRSKDQGKVTTNKFSPKQRSTAKSNSNHKPQTIVCGRSSDRKRSPTKKEKIVSKATAAKITTEELECKGVDIVLEEKRIDLTCENDTVLGGRSVDLTSENDTVLEGKMIDLASENDTVFEGKMIDLASENDTLLKGYSTETTDQLPTKEGTEHRDIQIGEYYNNSESSVCDVTLVTTDDQNNRRSIGEVDDDPIIPIGTDSESFMRGVSLKALLLSSPAFINHAEELFHLHVNIPTTSQKFGISDFTAANTRLYLDCAKEIVQRRRFPDSQMVHPPLLNLVGNVESHISLDHLLKETCDGIEALRSYSQLAGENYPNDSLYAMLERDMKLSEVLSAIWELGWRKGFSVDDKMQLVDDIEKQILSGLIEEVCA